MAQPPSLIYARQLLPMRYGYPLYYPEAMDSLPRELRGRGTGIGDVGVIKPDGSFQFAFNIFTTDTTINCFGVPDGFCVISLGHISRLANKHSKPSELMTEGRYKKSVGANLSVQASDGVALSSSESALLTMPDGAMGEDYTSLDEIRTYSIEHAISWYEFINGKLHRAAPNGSLYVVTGCDKSTAWGIATVGQHSSLQECSLQFTA
ncbi:hypothetical protein FIBSPDRAFT_721276, partial [Athelia psychrophila]